MDDEILEQYGVSLGDHPTATEKNQRQRQLRDVELEARQTLWRWLLVAALCVLVLETWLAGRKSRPTMAPVGEVT